MLCSKINLKERRIKQPKKSSNGPIVRPCSTINVLYEHKLPQLMTRNSADIPTKTPLIIITLNIPSEVETLAPKDTKRHPKKLPPFCWQQQQHHHHQPTSVETHSNDSNKLLPPQFLIRGIEIADHKAHVHKDDVTLPDDYIDDEVDVIDVISENNSNLLAINNKMTQNNNQSVNVSPTDCLINWDDYEMDNYGHLPGYTRTPTPISTMLRPSFLLRTPSPNTRQIIRVAVKMNREKRENEKNKFNVMDSKMTSARDVSDRKGRMKCDGNVMCE